MTNGISRTAIALALGTALISGGANFVNKFAVGAMSDPVAFTALKNGLVALLLIGSIVLFGKWTEIRTLSRGQWLKLGAIGIIGGSIPFALFFTGLAGTTALNAGLIHKTLFIWVALLAIPLLGERMTGKQWLGVAALFAANVVVGGFVGFRYNAAELMIVGATMLWAIENIIAKRALANISALTVAGARMVFGSALLLVYVALFRGGIPVAAMSPEQWGWTFATAAMLFGYVTTWYAALRRAPATIVAALLVPATFITNVLSAIFITHKFSGMDLLQACLLAAGVVFVIVFAKRVSDAKSQAAQAAGMQA